MEWVVRRMYLGASVRVSWSKIGVPGGINGDAGKVEIVVVLFFKYFFLYGTGVKGSPRNDDCFTL